MGHLVVHGAAMLRMRVTDDSRTLLGAVARRIQDGLELPGRAGQHQLLRAW